MPSALDDVPCAELMEIMWYRKLRDAEERQDKFDKKEEAARAGIEHLARENAEEKAKLGAGPKVLGQARGF